MKTCTLCKETKENSEFNKNQYWCRECAKKQRTEVYYSNLEECRRKKREYQKQYRDKNIERHRQYGKERYHKDRDKILARRLVYWKKNRAEINKRQLEHSRKNGVNPKPGYVYIARFPHLVGGKTIYKIGQSVTPFSRIDRISASSPVPVVLEILIKTDDMSMLESDLHNFFWKNNSNKEWFFLSKNDYKYIIKNYNCLLPPFPI